MTSSESLDLSCYVAGEKTVGPARLNVHSPYHRGLVGTVTLATRQDTEAAVRMALTGGEPPTRYERFAILDKARLLLEERREAFARLIVSESGLCLRETRYEVGRALDVLRFAAQEALRDAAIDDPDQYVKEQAVFALSQLPEDEGVPLLIDVARNNPNAKVREQAIFWLGQSRDAKALKALQDIILKSPEQE